ncbi:hypothetical protein [Hydrocoleum sp. CS-953]|uniref:hypothetical protein n=1 Tax=Hydrocoleum sp. CS-953 TaxID=1671698 RepID=UPI00143D71E0|nr:hypothetical protein [Hydrocoleum sp. CS-953]
MKSSLSNLPSNASFYETSISPSAIVRNLPRTSEAGASENETTISLSAIVKNLP